MKSQGELGYLLSLMSKIVPLLSLQGVNKARFRKDKTFIPFVQDYLAKAIACDFKRIAANN